MFRPSCSTVLLQVRAPRLLPVCSAVEVLLEPSEPVLPLENDESW